MLTLHTPEAGCRGPAPRIGPRGAVSGLRGFAALLIAIAATLAAAPSRAAAAADEGFPRSALEIRSSSGRQWFNILIADTEPRQELGLMFVTALPSDQGMLFPQETPRIMTMWMKNTLIPLDMLFIDGRGRIVCLIEQAKPQSLEILSCERPVKAVLELRGGEATKRGIRVGDKVTHAVFRR